MIAPKTGCALFSRSILEAELSLWGRDAHPDNPQPRSGEDVREGNAAPNRSMPPYRYTIWAPSVSQVRICVSQPGKRSCRRTWRNFATMVSSVTAMRVEPEPEIHSVLAPPSRHTRRMSS